MGRDNGKNGVDTDEEKRSLKEQKTRRKRKPLFRWLVTPVLLVILILLDHYTRINLTMVEMNIIFLLFFSANLIAAVLVRKNLHKIFWLLDVLNVCIIIMIQDVLRYDMDPLHGFSKIFCILWAVLAVPIFIYFIVVCVRVILWSQEKWEEIKKARQEEREKYILLRKDQKHRLTKITSRWHSYHKAAVTLANAQKQEAKLQSQEAKIQKQEAELQKQKLRYEAEAAEQKAKIEFEKTVHEMERLEEEEERQKEAQHKRNLNDIRRCREEEEANGRESRKNDGVKRHIKIDVKMAVKMAVPLKRLVDWFLNSLKSKSFYKFFTTIVVLVLFIMLPFIGGNGNMGKWKRGVEELMSSIEQEDETVSGNDVSGNSTPQSESGGINVAGSGDAPADGFLKSTVLVKYTIFFIAFIGCILMALLLCWKAGETLWEYLFESKDAVKGFGGFFAEYSTPFSVLIVAISVLSVFTNSGTKNMWDRLPDFFRNLACVVLIMLLILVAVDAVRLILMQCIERGSLLRTSFHLIFALFVENMMEIATSVLCCFNIGKMLSSLIAFFTPISYSKIYKKVGEVLDDALKMEIKIIRRAMKRHGKQVIGKKQKSAFKKFYSPNWSRRY